MSVVDVLRQDLRHTIRILRRSPGFTLTALLVTALGVGATTAAFTLTDHVLVRPLPFPQPERLVTIREGLVRGGTVQSTNDASPGNFLAWRELARSFEAMGAYRFVSLNLIGRGEPERLDGVSISHDAGTITGMRPALGQPLTPADDEYGAPCVVLLSDALWRRRFGADASIIGTSLVLEDEPCLVKGIMPRSFQFPTRSTMFWRPLRFAPAAATARTDRAHRVIARLKAGVSKPEAAAELAVVSAALAREYPQTNVDTVAVMLDLRDDVGDQSRMLLMALAGASACVLLIACSNLGSLQFARATARSRELAVRSAIGATRGRLVAQLLTESVLLACAGGACGLVVAIGAVPLVVRLVPTTLPIPDVPAVDVRMLAIAALVTLGTGIGFGVFPACRAAGLAGSAGLREGARSGASQNTQRLRSGLVVAQVGFCLVLLVSGGLLLRALVRVQSTPTGFNARGVLTLRTTLPWTKYGLRAPRVDFHRRVVEAVEALPGVTGAAYTSYLPMTMRGGVWPVSVPGRPEPTGGVGNASARYVTPHYFRVMEIPLTGGRAFDESDSPVAHQVAIVSEGFVQTFLEGRSPIGLAFLFGPAGERTIVGVVGEVRVRGLERPSEPQVYLPYQQQPDNSTLGYIPKDLVVRLDPSQAGEDHMAGVAAAIRRIVAAVDPHQPIADVQPLSAIVDGETTPRAVQLRVVGAFAALACLLAAVGLHGLLAFVVSTRRREYGVRLALGAEPRAILTSILRQGLVLGLAGVAAGSAVAIVTGRWLASLLFGINPADAATLAVAIGVCLSMTLAGSTLAALRAARTRPSEALKAE